MLAAYQESHIVSEPSEENKFKSIGANNDVARSSYRDDRVHVTQSIIGKPRCQSDLSIRHSILAILSTIMGWLWGSSSQKDEPVSTPTASTNTPESASQNVPPPKTLTPAEQADLEFSQLLASLQEAENNTSKNPQAKLSSNGETYPSEPTSSISEESLYADEMSCRTAFDYAFFCQSFGGQFVNVYRYGEMRSCSEHWDNFWLCMRTRSWSDDLRKKAIRAHNQKKAIRYKTGPSSEDVWDVRLEPAREAFKGDFAALEREMNAEAEVSQKAAA